MDGFEDWMRASLGVIGGSTSDMDSQLLQVFQDVGVLYSLRRLRGAEW